MIEGGLLDEVYNIYSQNADYTRGLRQAIGVREFEEFLFALISEVKERYNASWESATLKDADILIRQQLMEVLSSSSPDTTNRHLLGEAISKLKVNTRRLVRRQKRRITRLETFFGWKINYVDSTESLSGSSEDTWIPRVVEPAAKVISAFLSTGDISVSDDANSVVPNIGDRDLWTQYKCKACDKVLRGGHEWEQHKQGRAHRKRMAKLKKLQGYILNDSLQSSKGMAN